MVCCLWCLCRCLLLFADSCSLLLFGVVCTASCLRIAVSGCLVVVCSCCNGLSFVVVVVRLFVVMCRLPLDDAVRCCVLGCRLLFVLL